MFAETESAGKMEIADVATKKSRSEIATATACATEAEAEAGYLPNKNAQPA